METKLSSKTEEVIISDRGPAVLIGERINATGSKKVGEALKTGDMVTLCQEALTQVNAGADVLDVNVGMPGCDESILLPEVVQELADTVDVPLCLDSSSPKALEAALKVYRGKPLVNSVTGEEHSLQMVLPLIKEHRAAVVGLLMDDEGVSSDPDKRVVIATKIVERAATLGIPLEDIVIDCLAQSVGANHEAALVTIETIRKLRIAFPVNVILGASNVSFGLPDRSLLNSTFLAMAIASGASCAIVDVAQVRPVVLAADLLMGRDRYARRYIQAYRQRSRQ